MISKLNIDAKDLRGIGIQLTRLESAAENKNSALMKFLEANKQESGEKVVPSKKKEIASSSVNNNSSKRNSVVDLSLSQASIKYF